MTDTVRDKRASPWDEPFRHPEPIGPFVELKDIPAPDDNERYRLEMLAMATAEALRHARSAQLTYEWSRPWVGGANSAALAVAALERLVVELEAVEVAYGVGLFTNRTPGP